MRRTIGLIVGGGPAGAAAAIALARAGARPLLVERDREPRDALCGGFLSWTTLDRLAELGVDAWSLAAHRIDRLTIHAGSRRAESRLPGIAAGLSRRTLDSALIDGAEAAGAAVERGVAVRTLNDGVARFAGGAEIRAAAVILATGKHDLRDHARPRDNVDPSIGLRWRLSPSPALTRMCAGRIELHLFRRGYGGLLLQEDGSANFCMTVARSRLTEAGGDPARLLAVLASEAPQLEKRLAVTATIGPVQAIANIPYGWHAPKTEPGIYRVGDQAGVIPSLAGEGIGIALSTGIAAAAAIRRGSPADAYQKDIAGQLVRQLELAARIAGATEWVVSMPFLLAVANTMPVLFEMMAAKIRFR